MNPRKTNITLEDLLRVKRAERPPAEFWAKFEREMRAKERAAIVEPRPWWAPLIRIGARVTRHQLPIGAAAILALSFVTVREYRNYGIDRDHRAELAGSDAGQAGLALAAQPQTLAKLTAVQAVATREETAAPAAVLHAAIGQHAHTAPLENDVPAIQEPTPSARYIAANLAVLQAADPRLIEEAFGPATRRIEEAGPVRDPLAQIAMQGETRRSRLLSPALPAMAVAVPIGTSDRVASRLTEDRLYDSVSRVGVRGDRVAIRF